MSLQCRCNVAAMSDNAVIHLGLCYLIYFMLTIFIFLSGFLYSFDVIIPFCVLLEGSPLSFVYVYTTN